MSVAARHETMRIAGEPVDNPRRIEVRNPWDGSLVGTVPRATVADVRRAFTAARAFTARLTRYERSAILTRAAERLRARMDEVSDLITAESGLCKKDTRYEVGRACDVLTFSASAALVDDGQIFSCDISFDTIEEAIAIANSTAYGLSSAVCTNRLDWITRFVSELQVGTVNVREVPGYRLESSPFGGIKDSGLGYKEGVQEATYSLPWP